MTLKLFENILRMITKETSSKTEQLVVSPGHKPNNEQLKLCSIFMFCYYLLFCYKINLLLAENIISAQP